MSIATRLKKAIEERDISIREFQRRMAESSAKGDGTSYPAINRALQAEVIPSIRFLEAAADLLQVRRAWLMTGDGHMTERPMRERAHLLRTADFFAGSVPWEMLDEWLALVTELGLTPEETAKVHDVATAVFDAMEVMGIGEVTTLAGRRVYRPAPEFRHAMRLSLEAWHVLLSQWIDEVGLDTVRQLIRANIDLFSKRFTDLPPSAREYPIAPRPGRSAKIQREPRRTK